MFSIRVKGALISVKLWEGVEDVITLKQVHSDKVVYVNGQHFMQEGDALITDRVGIKIGVRTADCVPIVLVGSKKVGVIHAGWRGIKAGIIEKTVKLMEEDQRELIAFIGPSAKACCYEVGEEFKESFRSLIYRSGKFFMDTQDEVLLRLKSLGIERFIKWNSCTICNTRLPSHRRNKTEERLLTFVEKISLNPPIAY